jgi:hypothetical protein
MKKSASSTVRFALVWLALAASLAAQQAGPGSKPTAKRAEGLTFSGRVVDGLGRPVPGVKIRVRPSGKSREKAQEATLRTGEDGRYSGSLPTADDAWLIFEKEGYGGWRTTASSGAEITMNRKWDRNTLLRYSQGEELDRGMRELFASDEWVRDDEQLLGFLFDAQDEFRPALRRLLSDSHVGASARHWLELLDDPSDHDLFPKGRQYAPKKEVKETDLVEALKATARQRNFFSSAKEPFIDIDFIKFTRNLDRALIQCGINRVALTGVTWQFVFRKVGGRWELGSAYEAGRS